MEQTAQHTAVKAEAPAQLVCAIFGEEGAAAIAGVRIDAVRKWKRRKSSGGLGGLIPARYQHKFLRAAVVLDKVLSAEQLIAEPY